MKKILLLIILMSFSLGQSQNLLTNGDFENGATSWALGPQGTVTSGEAFYSSTNSGGNLWDTQLVQEGMSFTSGVTYSLSFKARAAENRDITVAIQNVGIWSDQFRQVYALTTSMQTYTATFTAPFTNGNVQIGFLMAAQGSTDAVYFDDVVIEEAGSPPATNPTINAPVPSQLPENVVSIFSDSYTNIATNYDPNWGQSGHTLVNFGYEAVSSSGNNILAYPNFNYQGTEIATTNLSNMEFLHIDLWTNAPTNSSTIQVSPINSGSGLGEVLVTLNHIQGEWYSVDIPKSAFTGMTWDNVIQMKFAANGPGSSVPIDIYLDNIYFWKNPIVVGADASLSDLQVDSSQVDNFSTDVLTYNVTLPIGTTVIPLITSVTTSDLDATFVITQAMALPGIASVLVTSADNSVQRTYTVNFAFPPPPSQPVGFVAINPTASSMFLAVGPNNTDGNIVYRLFYSPTATAPANPLTATQYTFGSTGGDGNGTTAFGFNLGGLNSSTNYTFWLYQFNTTTGIYSTPASSTNTTLTPPPVLVPPTTNAPIPTRNPANVVSIYSNTYDNIATNYDPNWGQSGHTQVNPNFEAVSGSGNTILHYPNFNYQGTELNATDLSSMEFLHVDLWTNAPTSSAIIQVSPINAGSGSGEVLVTINHIQGQWASVDLPKSLFAGMTWDNVLQMKFAANGPGSTTPIDIYLDNVYFWNNPGVSTDATLSDLQVDFVPVEGFSSSQFSYTYTLPFEATEIPQITSVTTNSSAATTLITQATSLPGSTTVVVTAEDNSVQLTYTVNFAFPPPPAQPVGFVALNPTSSSAFLACGPNNVDGNIVYRIFYSPTATAPANPTTANEYNFGDTAGDGNGVSPFGFVLSGLNSSTNYTFWLYQFNIAENQFSAPATTSLTTLCAPVNWYRDNDGDSYGDSNTLVSDCNSPGVNYVQVGDDCDDNDATVYPGAIDICYDGKDNDCDGIIDNGCTPIISVLQTSQCGITLPAINSYIYANVVAGAQGYRFKVTNMNTMEVQTIDKALRVFSITQLPNYAFDSTYQVEVSIKKYNVWQPFYGSPCTISTPIATTQVVASQCGSTVNDFGNIIYANSVSFATGYKFKVTNLNTEESVEITRALREFRLSLLANPQYGTSYSVEVAVRNTDGTYLPYGPVCIINTPGVITKSATIKDKDTSEFIVLAYPNPFSGSFKLSITSSSDETIQLRVYDMIGKIVENKTLNSSEINDLEIGNNYPSGIYNVIITQGEKTETARVIKR